MYVIESHLKPLEDQHSIMTSVMSVYCQIPYHCTIREQETKRDAICCPHCSDMKK